MKETSKVFELEILTWNPDSFVAVNDCVCFVNLITITKSIFHDTNTIFSCQVDFQIREMSGERESFFSINRTSANQPTFFSLFKTFSLFKRIGQLNKLTIRS